MADVGTKLSYLIYGGNLTIDNAGASAGIELLNYIFGANDASHCLAKGDTLNYVRYGHHKARLLAHLRVDEEITKNKNAAAQFEDIVFDGPKAKEVLGGLFAGLQMIPPNVKKTTDAGWTRRLFFPFTKSLIHWDVKPSNARIERVWMRGAGALLYKILRKDPDSERLRAIEVGLANLYKTTEDSPLDHLASFFRNASPNTKVTSDEVESKSKFGRDDFEDVFREGVFNILKGAEKNIPSVSRVKALLDWSTIWLVLMQYRRSEAFLERAVQPIVCDCRVSGSALRRLARKQLNHVVTTIGEALAYDKEEEYQAIKPGQRNKVRGFFASSASSIGLINAYTGSRYFTLKVNTLDAIVAALLPSGNEVSFSEFVDNLLPNKLGIVVSRNAARNSGLLDANDATIFESNEKDLAVQMKAAGLLEAYSDATQMVCKRG